MNSLLSFIKKNSLWILAILFMSLTLLLLYKVPFNGDDILNLNTPGSLIYQSHSLLQHTQIEFDFWLERGRFFPFAFYSYFIFTILPNLFSYRTFQICMNILVLFSAGFLMQRICHNKTMSAFFILLSALFFQYRFYHDPILSFHALLQVTSLYLIWSIYFFLSYFETKKRKFLFLSCLLYVFAMLTYEVSTPFLLLFWGITFLYLPTFKEKKTRLKRFFPVFFHSISAVLLIVFSFLLRFGYATKSYDGTTFSFVPKLIIKTFLIQLTAPIPLVYICSAGKNFSPILISLLSSCTWWDVFLILNFAFLVAFYLFKGTFSLSLPAKKLCLGVGMGLWIIPAALLSLSQRYQKDLHWGLGYLPVYIQYFGLQCILFLIVNTILEKIQKRYLKNLTILLFSLMMTFTFCLTWFSNRTVQKIFADAETFSLEWKALESGFFDFLQEGDEVILLGGSGAIQHNSSFPFLIAHFNDGIKITSIKEATFLETLLKDPAYMEKQANQDNSYFLLQKGNLEKGVIIFGKIDKIDYHQETKSISELYAKDLKLFYCGDKNDYLTLSSLVNVGAPAQPIPQTALGNLEKPFHLNQNQAFILDINFVEESVPVYSLINWWIP